MSISAFDVRGYILHCRGLAAYSVGSGGCCTAAFVAGTTSTARYTSTSCANIPSSTRSRSTPTGGNNGTDTFGVSSGVDEQPRGLGMLELAERLSHQWARPPTRSRHAWPEWGGCPLRPFSEIHRQVETNAVCIQLKISAGRRPASLWLWASGPWHYTSLSLNAAQVRQSPGRTGGFSAANTIRAPRCGLAESPPYPCARTGHSTGQGPREVGVRHWLPARVRRVAIEFANPRG